jgi:hypothetical protein
MKLFIAFIALTLSTITFACTDFSGIYQNQKDNSVFTIVQTGCETIGLTEDGLSFVINADGISRQVGSSDVIQNGEVVGHKTVYASATLGALDVNWNFTYLLESKVVTMRVSQEVVSTLNLDGDLVTTSKTEGGNPEITIFKRVK